MSNDRGLSSEGKNRQISIDIGRYLLLLGVIALHLPHADFASDFEIWWIAAQHIFHIAVPVYFVTAGYFLPWRTRSYARCISVPLTRVGPPYVFWLIIYITFFFATVSFSWPWSLYDLISGGPAYHLWFLPALLIGLVIVGVASKMGGMGGAFVVCVVLAAVGMSRGALHDLLHMPGTAQRAGIFMAPMFIWLGAAVRNFPLNRPKAWAIWLVVGVLVAMQGLENVILSFVTGSNLIIVRPFPMMMFPTSVAVFIGIQAIPSYIWPQWLIKQSYFTLGVYAIHLLVISVICTTFSISGPVSFIIILTAIFVVSSLIVRLLAQIRPLRQFLS